MEVRRKCPILMLPLVSCMWASCCNTPNLPQQQLSCSAQRRSWSWRFLYFSLCWLKSHHIWKATSSNWAKRQLCTELGGSGALGICSVQIQELRLWTEAVRDFPSWANTWLWKKQGSLTTPTTEGWDYGWKTGERLKDLHVLGSVKSRLAGNSLSVHILTRRLLHISTCLHIPQWTPAGWTQTKGTHCWARTPNQPPEGLGCTSTHSKCLRQKSALLFKRCSFSSTTI